MSIAEKQDGGRTFPVTADFARWVAGLNADAIPENAFTWARHALLDWFGVTIAGAREPLVEMLAAECEPAENAPCTLVGRAARSGLLDAALINGAASHALDYDDTHRRLHGHPTVCVAPVALALGEKLGLSGRDVLTGFIAGVEVACNLGEMSDESHYEAGFHATGTMGTFGAAAAAAKLMQLDPSATARALAIAASQASGLKINFGTMTKPLHAGKAAMNGLLAARLAARGFTAHETAIEAPQGFAAAEVPDFAGGPIRPDNTRPLAVEETLFKYHAACYLTHAALEAIAELRAKHGLDLDDVDTITLFIRPTHFTVCCIPAPQSGLEVKFSIQHVAVMALDGVDTGALASYSDENASDPRYVAAREEKVRIETRDDMDRMGAAVSIALKDGRTVRSEANAGFPASDVDRQWTKLSAKFTSLTEPVIGAQRAREVHEAVALLDEQDDLSVLMAAAR
ncbi:MAG: MmgE/PrpD family protein [Hyphomicrobiales bacterium]|nr:MmgE/PrpD family protein [Hyphomicrobiales bacterium]